MHGTDLHFTKEDTTANRYGRLTQAQEQRIAELYQTWRDHAVQSVVTFVTLFWVVVVMGVGVEFNRWAGSFADSVGRVAPYVEIALAIGIALLVIGVIVGFFITRDIRKRHIRIAEGVVSTHIKTSARGRPQYEVALRQNVFRSTVFRFPNDLSLQQFENGKHYRVYYIQFYPTLIVLSAEKVN